VVKHKEIGRRDIFTKNIMKKAQNDIDFIPSIMNHTISIVFNAEYVMPVGGPLYAVLFYDVGNAYSSAQKISLNDMYSSAGLEMRIYFSTLPIPIRLIFAYNNRKIDPEDTNLAFRFTLGTTF